MTDPRARWRELPPRRPDGRFVARSTVILSCPEPTCPWLYTPQDVDEEEFVRDMGCPNHPDTNGTIRDLLETDAITGAVRV